MRNRMKVTNLCTLQVHYLLQQVTSQSIKALLDPKEVASTVFNFYWHYAPCHNLHDLRLVFSDCPECLQSTGVLAVRYVLDNICLRPQSLPINFHKQFSAHSWTWWDIDHDLKQYASLNTEYVWANWFLYGNHKDHSKMPQANDLDLLGHPVKCPFDGIPYELAAFFFFFSFFRRRIWHFRRPSTMKETLYWPGILGKPYHR